MEVTRRYAALLVLAVLVSFAPAFVAGTTNWDDDGYLDGAAKPAWWLVTHTYYNNYQPLTMLSLHADYVLFGVNATELHAMNIAIHCVTVLAVFALLLQLTATPFAAFAGALLFAIHPLRVESVAWIAERKDVLCAAFFAAALALYAARLRGRAIHLGWIYVLFIAALLSKATATVLPLALMLIELAIRRRIAIVEKLPMLAISVLFGLLSVRLQVEDAHQAASFSMPQKLVFAAHALTTYVRRELVPLNLSAFYANPRTLGTTEWIDAILALLFCLAVLAMLRLSLPLFAASAFFLVTLAPMLPVVSVGKAGITDRYTYIPSIGIAWLIALGIERVRHREAIVTVLAVLFGVLTFQRTQMWHDSVSLWTSVLESDDTNALAWNGRGVALVMQKQTTLAASAFDHAIALQPCYDFALRNRGMVAMMTNDTATARAIAARLLDCHRIPGQ